MLKIKRLKVILIILLIVSLPITRVKGSSFVEDVLGKYIFGSLGEWNIGVGNLLGSYVGTKTHSAELDEWFIQELERKKQAGEITQEQIDQETDEALKGICDTKSDLYQIALDGISQRYKAKGINAYTAKGNYYTIEDEKISLPEIVGYLDTAHSQPNNYIIPALKGETKVVIWSGKKQITYVMLFRDVRWTYYGGYTMEQAEYYRDNSTPDLTALNGGYYGIFRAYAYNECAYHGYETDLDFGPSITDFNRDFDVITKEVINGNYDESEHEKIFVGTTNIDLNTPDFNIRTRDGTGVIDMTKMDADTNEKLRDGTITVDQVHEQVGVVECVGTKVVENDIVTEQEYTVEATEEETFPEIEDNKAKGLADVFPFCIPFDLYKIGQCFVAKPKPFGFVYKFKNLDDTDVNIDVNLGAFDTIASLVRDFNLVIFIIFLLINTKKLIHGSEG